MLFFKIDSAMENATVYPYDEKSWVADMVTMTVFIVTGLSGNALLIAVHCAHKTRAADQFVLNMVLFDSLDVMGLIPSLVSIVRRQSVLVGIPCIIWGWSNTVGVVGSLFSLTMVAMCRMVQVCYPSVYGRYFRKTQILIYCIVIWVVALLVCSPPAVGWGNYHFSYKFMMSGLDYSESWSYTLFLYMGSEGSCLVMTCAFYFNLYRTVKKSSDRMAAHGQESLRQQHKNRLRSAVYTFVLSAMFTLSWTPFCVLSVVDIFTEVDSYPIKITLWLGMNNSVINSWVYMSINRNYRQVLVKWMCNNSAAATTHRHQAVNANLSPGRMDDHKKRIVQSRQTEDSKVSTDEECDNAQAASATQHQTGEEEPRDESSQDVNHPTSGHIDSQSSEQSIDSLLRNIRPPSHMDTEKDQTSLQICKRLIDQVDEQFDEQYIQDEH